MPYRAPSIPEVPSSAIDRLLHSRFSDPPDNVLKAVVGHFVCAGFQSIMMTYFALRRGSPTDNFRLWIASCVLVSLTLTLACFVVFKVVVASGFIVKALLFYGMISLALVGMAMGVAGIALYDRNAKEPPTEAALAADEILGYEEYKGHPTRAASLSSASSTASASSGSNAAATEGQTEQGTTASNRKND